MVKKLKLRRQDAGGNDRGSDQGVSGGESEEDNVGGRPGREHDSRGRRGVSGRNGGSGSFERESDDYARNMGNEDRGKLNGGRSERDDDFTSLARQSRFGNQGEQGGDQGNRGDGGEGKRGGSVKTRAPAKAPRRS